MLKQFNAPITFKASEPGSFTAIFSTLSVIDKDQDVTVPGAFKHGQAVRLAQWGHNWEALPVGKGIIYADDSKAWVEGSFFLDTPHGAAHYQTVKNLGDLQEWSYGFTIEQSDFGDFNGERVRYLRALDVTEVSPVMVGAGVGTHTTAIKSGDLTYADQAGEAVTVLQAFVERSQAATAARAKEGRPIGRSNRERIRSVLAAMDAFAEVRAELESLIAESEPEPPPKDEPPDLTKAPDIEGLFLRSRILATSVLAKV